jgi:hypothetical protein
MKRFSVALFLLLPAVCLASERDDLELVLGAGAWIPTGSDFETTLTAGPAFTVGLQIPMFEQNCIFLRSGYRSAGSDSSAWDGVSCIPFELGYRAYPLYRKYAGPRGLEPFIGISAGGFLAWDSPAEGDGTSAGGGRIAAELGARIRVGEDTFVDIVFAPELMPLGKDLAAEDDLSGMTVGAMLSFVP